MSHLNFVSRTAPATPGFIIIYLAEQIDGQADRQTYMQMDTLRDRHFGYLTNGQTNKLLAFLCFNLLATKHYVYKLSSTLLNTLQWTLNNAKSQLLSVYFTALEHSEKQIWGTLKSTQVIKE